MSPRRSPEAPSSWLAAVLVIGALVVLLAQTVTVGADALWLVAMGQTIVRQGGIPEGIPFAAAPSQGWPNVPVLGELVFAATLKLGAWGLPVLQLAADAVLLVLITLGARRLGAGGLASAVAVLVAALGMLPALGVVRAQLLSLVPFAVLLLLLRSEHEAPSRRIWLLVPLVALWGNLHGAVLAGVAVAGCYLLLSRLRRTPLEATLVGVAALVALAVTPAHIRSGAYYLGVLDNEAARRGSELWAAPSLGHASDVLMLVAAAVLVGLALAARRPLWECATLIGLVLATTMAARHGPWLLLFVSGPAATLLSRLKGAGRDRTASNMGPALAAAAALTAMSVAILATRLSTFEAERPLIETVRQVAGDDVVLAPEPLVESLAASGVHVWVSNPIDAFSRQDQAAYLDFVAGQGPLAHRALAASDVVVAESGSGSAALALEAGFRVVQQVGPFDVLRRP